MNFRKPYFWNKKFSFISTILLPISYILVLISCFFKIREKKRFNVPVICVGNIYLGGTGKTPISIEIHNILKNLGKKPAFVKKYYKYLHDEIKLLQQKGRVFSEISREMSINKLIKNGYSHAILDDGFQDQSIHKDISLICFNHKQWIGNGRIIPAGPLRESLKNLKNANCILINGPRDLKKNQILKKYNRKLKIFNYKYILSYKKSLKKEKIVAFAGIGNPENFFELLKQENFKMVKTFSFPDHYEYQIKDLKNLTKFSQKNNATLVTTEKDYMRIRRKDKIKKVNIKLKFANLKSFMFYLKKII